MYSVSSIIKEKRKSLGLSIEKLAYESGLARKSIENAEKGENISLKTLAKILDSIGLEFVITDKRD